ncbi:cell growth-regulating nucleolar protein isoform X2 [Dendrobates tinctorius]|uniref:cell growth-regulating nucleolar protein isoform X2 n=1 Tax=Dendrobates tinctorius TaxID=92724 RepID=UPI003CC988F8
MVFFTCNGCGESLKKAQVEKHVGNCRSCQCLSCIDCGKDFWGSDYKTHLKCVTEDEKYGGKDFEAKAKKGEAKQVQWIQRIQEAMKKPTISTDVRNILNQISAFDNVPKKKAKFQNWMKNSLKIHSPTLQDKVWGIFEEAISNKNNGTETANAPAAESKSESSAATEETEKKSKRERKEERQKKNKKEKKELNEEELTQNGTKKKGKKRKMEDDERDGEKAAGKKKKKRQREKEAEDESRDVEEEAQSKKRNNSQGDEENGAEENGEEDSGKTAKFNWKGTIRALLRQAPDNELTIKKLRKKVIAQYCAISSEHHKSEEELLATFNKKIQNNPKFRVLKERVKLVK